MTRVSREYKMDKIKVTVIGVGSQSRKYLKYLAGNGKVKIDSLVDIDPNALQAFSDYPDLGLFATVDELLINKKPEVALVCLPHSAHREAVEKLLHAGVHVLKEKPFALDMDEAESYTAIQNNGGAKIAIAMKRRFDPVYRSYHDRFKDRLGDIIQFEATFGKNIENLGEGWRASHAAAGGGALLDMGYHFVDLIVWYFGLPEAISAELSFNNRAGQIYDVEDTANVFMTFAPEGTSKKFSGHLKVSRVSPFEKEEISIHGTQGYLTINKEGAALYDTKGTLIEKIDNSGTGVDSVALMLDTLTLDLMDGREIENTGIPQTQLIQDIYSAYRNKTSALEQAKAEVFAKAESDFPWPLITPETEDAVLKQLHTSVSIYNRSGIFKAFENKFAGYHNRRHALLSNSGTNAIFSMFEGLNLMPGDEIISPAYTFFATISPIVHTGAKPVFVDCGIDGNIDADKIEERITANTKAIIVTHMWGIPCEMDKIQEIAKKHNIPLLEDCSHAHGAIFKGQRCGEFGDAAAWSLQGQKIVTGGEGGIVLTDNDDLYYRAMLQGHYNKRCKQEIPAQHPLQKYALTGLGLKFRAHPLAIAMADQQFDHLNDWLKQKNIYASELLGVIADFDYIIPPNTVDRVPSWYAFVFQVNEENPQGVTAKALHAELQRRGLAEADLPTSTSPVYNLPLFTETQAVMPRLYQSPCVSPGQTFPNADVFYKQAVKLPVWTSPNDRVIFDRYKDVLYKTLTDMFGAPSRSLRATPSEFIPNG